MSENGTPARHLIFIADPMCSWCYGFAPVIDRLADHFGERLPIDMIMGGLRAGNRTPMTKAERRALAGHWRKVQEATGQPFDFGLLERDGFVYDTEPACRAVVTMRLLNPVLALPFTMRLQHAFYAENRDTTAEPVLADLAAEAGVDREMFFAEMISPEARNATMRDFLMAQEAGVKGFPTLMAGDGEGHYLIVANGYRPLDGLPEALEKWLDT